MLYEDVVDNVSSALQYADDDDLYKAWDNIRNDVSGEEIFRMSEFNDVMKYETPWSIVEMACGGEFDPNDDYFIMSDFGALKSSNYIADLVDLDEWARYCIDNDDDFGIEEVRQFLDEAKNDTDGEESEQ